MNLPPVVEQLAREHFTRYVVREPVCYGEQAAGIVLLVAYTPARTAQFGERVQRFARALIRAPTRLKLSYGYLVTTDMYALMLTVQPTKGNHHGGSTSDNHRSSSTTSRLAGSSKDMTLDDIEQLTRSAERWITSRDAQYVKQHQDEQTATVELDASNGDGTRTVNVYAHSEAHGVDMKYELLFDDQAVLVQSRLHPSSKCHMCEREAQEYEYDRNQYSR